jgi:hypothetical protein
VSESHPFDAGAHPEIPGIVARTRQQLLHAIDGFRPADRLQIHVAVENLVGEPVHPRPALADLAIGNGRQMLGQHTAEGAHDLLDRLEGDTSDEQQIVTHGSHPAPTRRRAKS